MGCICSRGGDQQTGARGMKRVGSPGKNTGDELG